MSLNISDVMLDRAESYVVREHTVVVGAYRINQNGLYEHVDPVMSDEEEMEEEEEEEYEAEEQQIEILQPSPTEAEEADETELDIIASLNRSSDCQPRSHRRRSSNNSFTLPALPPRALFDTASAAAEMVESFEGVKEGEEQSKSQQNLLCVPSSPTIGLMATDLPDLEAAYAAAARRKSGGAGSRRGSGVGAIAGARRKSVIGGASIQPAQAMSLSREDLVELEMIGRGQNGIVRKAVHLPTLTRVALKSMDVYDKSTRHQLLHELHAYSGLSSSSLIRLLGAYHDSGVIYLASEYMDLGSLTHCMKRQGGWIGEEGVLKHVSYQVLKGLKYLHDNHRLHRDIKPDNILLNRKNECKLADFGLMMKLNPQEPIATEFMGTLAYLSPERLSSSPYSYPSDIWSFGISLIYACTGHLPVVGASFWEFLGQMEEENPTLEGTLRKIGEGKLRRPVGVQEGGQEGGKKEEGGVQSEVPQMSPVSPKSDRSGASPILQDSLSYSPPSLPLSLSFSPSFHDFIGKMLAMKPEDRWTAEQLLEHPFLADPEAFTEASCSVSSFWSPSSVQHRNDDDLDLILEILAKRQLLKMATTEASRLQNLMQDHRSALLGVKSPGYAADSTSEEPSNQYSTHGTEPAGMMSTSVKSVASPRSEAAAASPTRANLTTSGLLSTFPHPSLKLSTSPPNFNTEQKHPVISPPSSSMSSAASALSSVSSTKSFSSFGSSLSSVRGSHGNFFSPDSQSERGFGGMGIVEEDGEATVHSDDSYPLTSSSLLSLSSSPLCSSTSSGTPFGSPAAFVAAGVGSFVSPSPEPVRRTGSGLREETNALEASPFILPAAPSMASTFASMTLPAAPDFLSPPVVSNAQDSIFAGVTPEPDSVEILAVVKRLDLIRTRVLANQFSRSCEEIQARYQEVQVALFDQMEQEQRGGEEAATASQQQTPEARSATPEDPHRHDVSAKLKMRVSPPTDLAQSPTRHHEASDPID
jgi:serine/threonine protein kinase